MCMISFNDEIKKFRPILEIADIEKSSKEDEMADMLELLQHLAKNVSAAEDK